MTDPAIRHADYILSLTARPRRFFHTLYHLIRLDLPPHRAVTLKRYWRTLSIECDCGRIFWRASDD